MSILDSRSCATSLLLDSFGFLFQAPRDLPTGTRSLHWCLPQSPYERIPRETLSRFGPVHFWCSEGPLCQKTHHYTASRTCRLISWQSVGWVISWGGLKMHANQTFLTFPMRPFSNDLLIYVPAQWKLQADNDANACGITKWIMKWKVQKHRGRVPRLLLQAASTQVANKKMHVAYELRFEAFCKCQIHLLHPQQACKEVHEVAGYRWEVSGNGETYLGLITKY